MTGQRLALLVAADQFADRQIAALTAPQADIDALTALLADADIGGFQVERLVNCTSQELRLGLHRLFANRDPDDFCLFHISSHGLKDPSGELYLATSDTQREYLEATSVEASYLRRQMDHSRAGAVVVFLDCCYGGAFERGAVMRGGPDVDLSHTLVPASEGRGRAVITASTAIEYAFEGATLLPGTKPTPSVFTEAVVAGIRSGSADPGRADAITLSELFTFISRRVRQRSPHQTPQWWLYGLSGDLVIARNPNPVVIAKDLPDDLNEVLRLPQPAARVGAVVALRELLRGPDAGMALAAYRTLETLADDDSRQVSRAAAEALDEVQVGVSPQAVDFGLVTVGQQVAPVTLELSGSLAPACSLSAGGMPVELVRRGARVQVRLDTFTAAEVDGRIEVSGPGGGALVPVRARIVTKPVQVPEVAAGTSVPTPPLPSPDPSTRNGRRRRPSRPVSEADDVAADPSAAPPSGALSDRSKRESWLLIGLWVVTIVTLLAGFMPGGYTGQTWYDHIQPNLSPLAIVAAPAAILGLQLARTSRARMAFAAGTAGASLFSAVTAAAIIAIGDPWQEVVVQLIGAILIACLAVTMALWASKQVAAEPSRASTVTTVLLVVLAAAAVGGIWGVMQRAAYSPIFPFLLGVNIAWVALPLALVLPVKSRERVALGSFTIGLLGTAALYTVGPGVPTEAFINAAGSITVCIVVLTHLRPSWRSLHDKATKA